MVLSGICTCQPRLQTSHRPDGIFTCFARVLAGWRCAHRRWHGDLLIVHHNWQHSLLCACSLSKVPIAPMGKLLTCLRRLTLAQLRPTLWSTTERTCRRDLEISHGPHGRLMFCSFLQGGGVFVYSGTVTMTSCSITGNTASGSVRSHVQNFPSPRWENG